MPDWLAQGFFIAMMIGFPVALVALFIFAYLKQKKEGEMWENLDDETLEEMSGEAEDTSLDEAAEDLDLDEEDAEESEKEPA